MANTAQAKKRIRQNLKHYTHNKAMRSKMRTLIKNAVKLIQDGQLEGAKTACHLAMQNIDRLTGKGLVHRNAGARLKSRLNTKLKNLALKK